jgi:uncharacterized surface protein with fasciclin (FAS1) repeats
MLDSLPNATFFDSAYRHAGMDAYLDSLRGKTTGAPYTIFVPTDDAFRAAGFTLQQIGQSSKAVLDSLLLYLTGAGSYTYGSLDSLSGSSALNTLLTDPNMQRTLGYNSGFSTYAPYQYVLYTCVKNGTLWLNGNPVRTAAQSLQATNGVVWPIDLLVQKPFFESYQVLASDTTYYFYKMALHISDSIYQSYYQNYYFSDTLGLQVKQGQPYITVLAPTNQAFRNAGFTNIAAIYAYIYSSYAVNHNGTNQQNQPVRTNLDSVLDLHRVGYAPYSAFNNPYFQVVLFTEDMLTDPAVNNMLLWYAEAYDNGQTSAYTDVDFQDNNGQVVVHRADAPGGRAVNVIAPHDVYTLNGVVHRVDNLLLPTP